MIAFAVLVVERPTAFLGERIALASHELSGNDAARALSRALGRDLHAEQIAAEELSAPLRALFTWLEETGHAVDIQAVHSRYPEIRWHRYEGWARLQTPHLESLLARSNQLVCR